MLIGDYSSCWHLDYDRFQVRWKQITTWWLMWLWWHSWWAEIIVSAANLSLPWFSVKLETVAHQLLQVDAIHFNRWNIECHECMAKVNAIQCFNLYYRSTNSTISFWVFARAVEQYRWYFMMFDCRLDEHENIKSVII